MRLGSIGGLLLAATAGLKAGGPTRVTAPAVATVVRADARSGRLVRRITVVKPEGTPRAAALAALGLAPAQIDAMVRDLAEQHGVEPALVRAVIQVESGYDPFAVSNKGAQGLMQLMPGTARQLSVRNAFSPLENIEGGVRHLKYLLGLFGGRLEPALAAYNAGPGAVAKYGGVPPYRETADYVAKIGRKLEQARRAAGQAAQDEPRDAAEHPRLVEYVAADGTVYLRTQPTP